MRFKLRKRIFWMKVSPRHKQFSGGGVVVIFLMVALVSGFYFLDLKIRPTLKYLAGAKAKQIATRAVNEAINVNISPDIQYQNVINVIFDKDGKVAFMQPNTGEINRLSSLATMAVQKRLRQLAKQTINIPVTQVLGMKILSNYGPNLPVKVYSIGIVESNIDDSFDVAGINQVRHRVFINVQATVKMVIPLVYQEIRVVTRILLTEAVVMGQVPNIYVNGGGGLIIPGDSKSK